MQIVMHFALDVETYRDGFDRLVIPRPQQCPHCQGVETLRSHGTYPRKALGQERLPYGLRIQRWYCRQCGKTVSVLPSFLLRFRHYLVVVIQGVVVSRYEQARSWSQVEAQATVDGLPSMRTVGRWCRSFAEQAPGWLARVQQTLAQQDSASPWLDPLGEAAHAGAAPRALLQAAVHLLAWAQSRWRALQSDGLIARLSALWQWGYTQGIARLV